MIGFSLSPFTLDLTFSKKRIKAVQRFFAQRSLMIILLIVSIVSVLSFFYFLDNGLGLAYNDARSHLNIGRRVVEGLKPGFAQVGSVWLPLTHILMVPTVWSDTMWHTGLSGALQSMISLVATAYVVYFFLRSVGVSLLGRIFGVIVFVANLNILYLQSTAMTELLLLATMTAGTYALVQWFKEEKIIYLITASFWIMCSTLIRYDGWFLFLFAAVTVGFYTLKKKGFRTAEGTFILFCTLGGFGIMLWLLWNLLIFKDMFYFAFGPFSARAQQEQLEAAGNLATKGDILLSLKMYFYAMIYNTGAFTMLLGVIGAICFFFDKRITTPIKIGSLALFSPLLFNILALYLGHSVLFIQGISGNTWFNVRYGVMMVPSFAIFAGYLFYRARPLRLVILGLFLFATTFAFLGRDAVTIDDATTGASQKNVTEVSSWLRTNAGGKDGFVLISAASHDAVIFSSGMPMKRFIHEGTGRYWEEATEHPDTWARWVVLRTYDVNDSTYRELKDNESFKTKYNWVVKLPFADVYELKPEYIKYVRTKEVYASQK